MNILTIDVEDWYQDLDVKDWRFCEDRIVHSTNKVLEILSKTKTKATFFVLGYIAERFPELIESIKREDHEIASHGYSHTPITKQTSLEFEEDLKRSIYILQGITSNQVLGFRAPQFSISKRTAWAIDILKKLGIRYDSSVFPTKTHLYGVPNAPRHPYRISSLNITRDDPEGEILEIPLSVWQIPLVGKNIPIAGGFYLRFFPYFFIRHALREINKNSHPAICYLHPWELDPEQPKIKELSWYHYYRLSSTETKFRKLLKDFEFTSVRRCLDF